MIVQMLFNPAQQLMQQRMLGAFKAGLAAAPSASLRPDCSLEQRQLSSPCTFLHVSSALSFLENQGSVIFWLLILILSCRFYADSRKSPEGLSFGAKRVNTIDD